MTFGRIASIIPGSIRRTFNRAIGRQNSSSDASATTAEVPLRAPIPDTLEGETFGQRQHRAIRESFYLRPVTSDGITGSPTDYATLLSSLQSDSPVENPVEATNTAISSIHSDSTPDKGSEIKPGDQIALVLSPRVPSTLRIHKYGKQKCHKIRAMGRTQAGCQPCPWRANRERNQPSTQDTLETTTAI